MRKVDKPSQVRMGNAAYESYISGIATTVYRHIIKTPGVIFIFNIRNRNGKMRTGTVRMDRFYNLIKKEIKKAYES